MKYTGDTFTKEPISLDNNTFKECTFIGCTLEYSGGKPPIMENCTLTESKFSFSDQAADTINFMKAMYHGGFKPVIEKTFEEIKTADKTNKH